MRIRTSVSLIAMGVAIAAAAPAAAQTTAGAVQPPSGTGQTAPAQTATDDFATANDIRSSVVAGEQAATSGGDIVVTGTRIVRPNNRSAAPITTVTSAEIQAQGAVNIEEVMNNLPQVQANTEQNFSQSEGRQRLKLRALGFERTLTLIDGMRIGLANTVDVGIVPTALVERIDVLSGGASSVYGSDAVAGVINFVLKKNFEGIRLDANYNFFNHQNRENAITEAAGRAGFGIPRGLTNDGARVNVTLSAGANFFDNRVNLTSFINYRSADLLEYSSRSISACQVTQPVRDGPLRCGLDVFTAAGTIQPRSGAFNGQFLVNNPNGDGTFVPLNSGPLTVSNGFDRQSFQREFERVNAGGFLTVDVSDDIELYSTAIYYRDRSQNNLRQLSFPSGSLGNQGFYSVNCNNPLLSTAQAQAICGAAAGTSALAPLDIYYRFDGAPGRQQRFENSGYRVTSGLRGTGFGGDWTYDIAGMINRTQYLNSTIAAPGFDRISRSLNVVNVNGTPTCQSVVDGSDPSCVPFNAFRPFQSDQRLVDYLLTGNNAAQGLVSRLIQVVGTVSGDLGNYGLQSPLADEGIAIALGTEFRSELTSRTNNAEWEELFGGVGGRLTQSIYEANAEVSVPLVRDQSWTESLDLNAGYRISEYNLLSGSFDTWKIEGIWSPISDITLRGSYNKSQRAPFINEANSAADVFFEAGFFTDPCGTRVNPADPNGARLPPLARIEQCRNTGLPDNLYGSDTLNCLNEQCTVRNGGFNLTPESAFTTTFGVILRPRFLPGLTVSADRFLINLEDSIGFYQATDWLNGCLQFGVDFFCRGVLRNPGTFTLNSPPGSNPDRGYVARGLANGFTNKNHGWDFQGQYNLSLGARGRLDVGFNGTLMTQVGGQDAPTVPLKNCVGLFGPNCGESLPRWMHSFRTTWISSDQTVNISLNWRHRSPIGLSFNAGPEAGLPFTPADRRETYNRIQAYDWFDLAMSFDIARQYSLRVSVNNLFDRDPPILPDSRNILGLLFNNTVMGYDMLGRNINIGLGVNF